MPHSRTAIVFDLDDTLYPEWQFAFSGFEAVARCFTHVLGPASAAVAVMKQLFDSADRGRVFDELLSRCGVSRTDGDSLVPQMVQTYRTHAPCISLHPDAARAIDLLQGRMSLGLLSDGFYETQNAKADALGLRDRIEHRVFTGQWGREFWKPHPRGYETIARLLKRQHHECVYVADNPAKDFVAPNRLGWRSIQIARPDGIYKDIPPADGGAPQVIIASLDVLEDHL